MPRAMLLPLPTPKASTRPMATAAMMTTRAIPDGTMAVMTKFEMISPSSSRG